MAESEELNFHGHMALGRGIIQRTDQSYVATGSEHQNSNLVNSAPATTIIEMNQAGHYYGQQHINGHQLGTTHQLQPVSVTYTYPAMPLAHQVSDYTVAGGHMGINPDGTSFSISPIIMPLPRNGPIVHNEPIPVMTTFYEPSQNMNMVPSTGWTSHSIPVESVSSMSPAGRPMSGGQIINVTVHVPAEQVSPSMNVCSMANAEVQETTSTTDETEENEIIKTTPVLPVVAKKSKVAVKAANPAEAPLEAGDKKCIICLSSKEFVYTAEDIRSNILECLSDVMKSLNLKSLDLKNAQDSEGICMQCLGNIQVWYVFHAAVTKRHDSADDNDERLHKPLDLESYQIRVYKNFKKLEKVKEIYEAATHAHYVRRRLTDTDWDFFCDHLSQSSSAKSAKSKELERFLMSKETLSHIYCTMCQKLIQTPNGKRDFELHFSSEHANSTMMLPCELCGKHFPEVDLSASTEDFFPHWISHFFLHECTECQKRFPTKRALGQHHHAVHKDRKVKCDRCEKVLANKLSLNLHRMTHLTDEERKHFMVKCEICEKMIVQWNFKTHVETHSGKRPWKCETCSAAFKTKAALVSHRDVVHLNRKNYTCSVCNEAFKSASSLRGHMSRHEGRKDFKCQDCGKEFYTISAMKCHATVHQETRNFVCDECGKRFKKEKSLKEHVTIHTGQKLYQCPICSREIRIKSNLYKHMKIHRKPTEKIPKPKNSAKKREAEAESQKPGQDDDVPDKSNQSRISSVATGVIVHTNAKSSSGSVDTEHLPGPQTPSNIQRGSSPLAKVDSSNNQFYVTEERSTTAPMNIEAADGSDDTSVVHSVSLPSHETYCNV